MFQNPLKTFQIIVGKRCEIVLTKSVVFNLPRLPEKQTVTGHGNTSIIMHYSPNTIDASRLMPNTAVYRTLYTFPHPIMVYVTIQAFG
jgi:hypothetical protein